MHYCPTNLVDRWKASVGPSLGKSTFQHYCNALRAYVLPYFKDHQFQAITNEEIQKFINQQAKRYSASSLYGVSGWHDPEAPHCGLTSSSRTKPREWWIGARPAADRWQTRNNVVGFSERY